jgi:NTE family protein
MEKPKKKAKKIELREKLGLALSGGGFRASFFHIGALAQMATLGLLRYVEVISTVSGGSIIGALYYLLLKKMLEEKADKDIKDHHYVELIEKIEHDFLNAVQRNIRMRTFSNPLKNIRMSRANYSRSDRIGELYDRYFYRKVIDSKRKTPVEMRDLKICPGGKDFYPRVDNAARNAKVPILLINATVLNTGHNWRFEASKMGEPPRIDDVASDIDKNLRLLRPSSYKDVIIKQQNIELGLAVAASASVPGLFHPLAISGLYPEGIRVQLVDGGVHDNQGIQGLFDENCTKFIVSDASGQMRDEPDPSTGIAPVLFRMNSILMDRVREEQMIRLFQEFGVNKSHVAFMHLRKGLQARTVPWIGLDGKPAKEVKTERQDDDKLTEFGVAQSVQNLLSRLRTDLDTFTDIEAYSLMLDGYKMSKREIYGAKGIKELVKNDRKSDSTKWNFLDIALWMSSPTRGYKKHLEVGGQRFFKVFRLSKLLPVLVSCFGISILIALGIIVKDEVVALFSRSFKVGQILLAILVLLLGFIPKLSRAIKVLRFLRKPSEFMSRLIIRGLLPAVGSLFINLHLWIFDPIFVRLGKLKKLD